MRTSGFAKGFPIHDGRKYRMLNVVDEFTLESRAIWVRRKLKSIDLIDVSS